MADSLVIYYQPSADDASSDHASLVLINEQGKLASKPEQGSLSNITAIAKGKRATVLLDSANLNIESVKIPGQNKQRQLQAVPFALEEQLASDIEEMHFAIGKKISDQDLPVISINRNILDQCLQQLKNANVSVTVMGADVLALPISANSWTILVDGQSALIKTGTTSGYYCDRDNLDFILNGLLKNNTPETISLFHQDNDSHAANLLTDIDITLKIKTYANNKLEVFAQNLTDAQQFNILQGDYAPKSQSSQLLKPWKSVAALFATWMVVQLITANIEISQLKEKNQTLNSQIEKQFKQANPGARKFNNMRKRMERKLKQLQTGGSGNDPLFLDILANATPAFTKTKNVNIEGIVFRNKYVDMDLRADSLQSLEDIKALLSANRKLKVVMSTSVEKDKTKGRLRLETQGASQG